MSGGWPPDPHSFEEGDDRGRPARHGPKHVAVAVLDWLRASDAAAREVLHQAEEERQVLGGDPPLIERQDEAASAGVNQEVRVLDPFRNTLVRQKLANIVAGEELAELFRGNVGIDGHLLLREPAPLTRFAPSGQETEQYRETSH